MRARRLLAAALTAVIVISGCERAAAPTPSPATVAPPPDAATPLTIEPWPLPSPVGAAQPDLVALADGSLLLSWIEPDGDGHALRFARWQDDAWSAPRTIARGDDWFVNWADTPHLMATPDGALWAHWLRRSAAAKYAYDVVLARSGDGGATWSPPHAVNDDGTPTEHGFVSMWPAARDRLGIAWLDGRRTGGGGHDGHAGDHGAAGAMTLRTADFDAALARHDERELDASTCDCCNTDAALTARGPLLVYRDRSADEVTTDEIRDIATVRRGAGGWSAPRTLHADGWRMPACPVNGPALAARDARVAVGWYTAAGDTPVLKLALSDDAGERFGAPVELDRGSEVQGRVDVALHGGTVLALWLREGADGQSLRLARWPAGAAAPQAGLELARLQGRGRGTGFPRLVAAAGDARAVWTDVIDGRPRLNGVRVSGAD